MQVTSETTVAVPIETVWDALSDHVGIGRWAPRKICVKQA